MHDTSRRFAPAAAERCARGEARWSSVDVFADRALGLLAGAMVALVLSTSLLFAAPAVPDAHAQQSEPRARAIVNGHPVQPGGAIPGHPIYPAGMPRTSSGCIVS